MRTGQNCHTHYVYLSYILENSIGTKLSHPECYCCYYYHYFYYYYYYYLPRSTNELYHYNYGHCFATTTYFELAVYLVALTTYC